MTLANMWKFGTVLWKGLYLAKTALSRSVRSFRSVGKVYSGLSTIVLFYLFMAIVSLTSNSHSHSDLDIPLVTSPASPSKSKYIYADLATLDDPSLKTILFWTPYYNKSDYTVGFGQEPFIKGGCKVTNCFTTADRNLLNRSDAVIFHSFQFSKQDLPELRSPQQRFVFFSYETDLLRSPSVLPVKKFKPHYFNWTMTQRRDSDIYIESRAVVHLMTDHPNSNFLPGVDRKYPQLASKTRSVAGFNSHCPTGSKRTDYITELAKNVQVDIYGKCGTIECLPRDSPRCNNLLTNYKFYLVDEDANCPNTFSVEDFDKALMNDVVPIVYGGPDYTDHAPPRSFINAADFKSPINLAKCLALLDRNEALYMEYFQWKKHYAVVTSPMKGWCDLCAKLNDPEQKAETKSYEDVAGWWMRKPSLDKFC